MAELWGGCPEGDGECVLSLLDQPLEGKGSSSSRCVAGTSWVTVLLMRVYPPLSSHAACGGHFCVLLAKQLLAPWEVCRFKASNEKSVHPFLKCGFGFGGDGGVS